MQFFYQTFIFDVKPQEALKAYLLCYSLQGWEDGWLMFCSQMHVKHTQTQRRCRDGDCVEQRSL